MGVKVRAARVWRRVVSWRVLIVAALLLARPAAAQPADPLPWRTVYERSGTVAAPALDLRAVGDVTAARGVGEALRHHELGVLVRGAGDALAGDLRVGNLEGPLTARAPRAGALRLVGSPAAADELAPAFDALSVANNHAGDAGPAGRADTVRTLAAAGVAPVGETPVVVRSAHGDLWFVALDLVDAGEAAGAAAERAVARAARHGAPVVVLVHWGDEYATAPSATQRAWARRLAAAGASVVIGAHPHVMQPVEVLYVGGRPVVVAYSLGNFLFDGPAERAANNGAVLRVLFDARGVAAASVLPLDTTRLRPRPHRGPVP